MIELNRKLTERQRRFADNYVRNGRNAYQAAIKAGYSKYTADKASKQLGENPRIKHYLRMQYNTVVKRKSRSKLTMQDVIANMLKKGAGKSQRRRYRKIDNKDPTQSTDITLIGPASSRDQVNAAKLVMAVAGLLHSDSKAFENAKIRNINADTKVKKNKLPEANGNSNRKPLFIDSVVKFHRQHEKSLAAKNDSKNGKN